MFFVMPRTSLRYRLYAWREFLRFVGSHSLNILSLDAFPFGLSCLNLQHYRARAHWDDWRHTARSDVRPPSPSFADDPLAVMYILQTTPLALPDHVIAPGDPGKVSLNFGDLRGSRANAHAGV